MEGRRSLEAWQPRRLCTGVGVVKVCADRLRLVGRRSEARGARSVKHLAQEERIMANQTPTGADKEQAAKGQAQGAAKGQPQQAQPAQQAEGGRATEGTLARSHQRAGQPSSGLSRRTSSAPPLGSLWGASPFALMRRMMDDMDRLFDEYVPGRFAPSSERRDLQPRGMPFAAVWEPQVDVLQREGKLVVRADLPGLSKDDVRVEITDEGLVLAGERRSEIEEEREGMYRAERSYGSFRRAIPLPEGFDASGAEAHFENGVLEITLPMPEAKSRAKRIEIQEGKPSPKPSAMH